MTTTTTTVYAAGIPVELPAPLAALLGWVAFTDGTGRWGSEPLTLIEALSEGLTGTAAGLRAVAIREQRLHAARTAHAEREAADKRLHAARVERQARIIAARAAGLSQAQIDAIL